MLQVKNISIGFKGNSLYKELDFTILPGQLTALLGRNGTGKTTLLRVLAGFRKPLSGEVLLNGQNLHRLAVRELAHKVAVVTTEKPAMGYFTAKEVAMLGRLPYHSPTDEDELAVANAFALTGMSHLATRLYDSLSDGEKQTVLVTRALAQNTPILLLDEPTAHLDFVARQEFFSLLQNVAHQAGKGVLIATHEVLLAQAFADKILFFEKGGGWIWGDAKDASGWEVLRETFLLS